MKSPAKLFLLVVWVGVIGGAAWGWWQFSQSGVPAVFSLLKQGTFMQPAASMPEMSWDEDEANEPSVPSETLCMKDTVQRVEEQLNAYKAEQEGQNPDAIKISSFSVQAKACTQVPDLVTVAEAQLSCMSGTCSYYIEFKQDGHEVAMFTGSHLATQEGWRTTCSAMEPTIGKIVCAEISSPETIVL